MKNQTSTAKYGRTTFLLFTLPALLFYTLIWGVNFVSGLYYSLTDWNGLSSDYNMVGLSNYIRIFSSNRIFSSLQVTFKYAFILVFFTILLSLLLALALNRKIRFLTFFRSVFFFPAMISLVTASLIFDKIFFYVVPKAGQLLGLDFLSNNLLAMPDTALYGVLVVNIWQAVAIPTVLFIAGLQSVPQELYESAALDGAGNVKSFFSITLPYIIPVLSVNLVLSFKAGITVFDYILILTNGGPAGKTEVVSMLIYNHGFGSFRFGYANAEAMILFVIIAVVSLLQITFLNKKGVAS